MPYSILGVSKGPLAPTAGSTAYHMLSSYLQGITSEANAQYKIPVAGTFKFAEVRLDANAASGGSQVLTLRKNGADTALVVNIVNGASDLDHSNDTDSVHVDAGDLVNWKYVTTVVGNVATIRGIYVYFLPDDQTITMTCFGAGAFSAPATISAAQNNLHMLHARLNAGENLSLPVNREIRMLIAGTLQYFGLRSSAGGKSAVQRIYKNQTVDPTDRASFAQDVLGFAYHDTDPITIAENDDLIAKIEIGSSGGDRVLYHMFMWLKNTVQKSMIGFGDQNGLALAGTASTTYYSILQGGGSASTDENDVAWPVKINCTLRKMTIMISSYSANGTSTVRLRKNGAFGNQTITINSGDPTGLKQDTTNSDVLAPGDEICIQVNPGGTSGIMGWMWVMFEVTDDNTYLRNLTRTITHDLTIVSDHVRARGLLPRTITHALAITSGHVKLRNRLRTITHVLTLTNTHTRLTNRLRTITHALTIASTHSRLKTILARTMTHSLTITSNHTRLRNKLRTITDGITIAHTFIQLRAGVKIIAHSLAITAGFNRSTNRLRTITHALAFTSDHARFRGLLQLMTHSLAFTSTHVRLRMLWQIITENLTLASTHSRTKGKWKTITEALTITSTHSRFKSINRAVTHALTFASTYNRLRGLIQTITHSLTLTSTHNRYKGLNRAVSHSISLASDHVRIRLLTQQITHTMGFTSTHIASSLRYLFIRRLRIRSNKSNI